jgi:hypothetical protein
MPSEPDDKPRRVVIAPPPSHPGLQATVLDVECAADEEVEWLWTDTPDGRFISGYQIIPRISLPAPILIE